MKNNNTIAILMATYNGQEYIKEQIDSILAQTIDDWTLFIHDDGSTDETLYIINQFQHEDKRIVLIEDDAKHLGPGLGFMTLLEIVDSELYMFCDQDDVWLNDKIEVTYNKYREFEGHFDIPIVVHTDVSVVDKHLNIMAPSYWKDINLNPDRINSYPYFCICCYTNGNTMLFNNKAKEICFPLQEGKIMHDRYVSGRVLKHGGIVTAVHKPLVLYRQHDTNVCGFQVGKNNSLTNRFKHLKKIIYNNYDKYCILKQENYGSVFKYLYYKMLVEIHLRVRKNY